jgi:hypothetical protein
MATIQYNRSLKFNSPAVDIEKEVYTHNRTINSFKNCISCKNMDRTEGHYAR